MLKSIIQVTLHKRFYTYMSTYVITHQHSAYILHASLSHTHTHTHNTHQHTHTHTHTFTSVQNLTKNWLKSKSIKLHLYLYIPYVYVQYISFYVGSFAAIHVFTANCFILLIFLVYLNGICMYLLLVLHYLLNEAQTPWLGAD